MKPCRGILVCADIGKALWVGHAPPVNLRLNKFRPRWAAGRGGGSRNVPGCRPRFGRRVVTAWLVGGCLATELALAAQTPTIPFLGDPPTPPGDVTGLPRGFHRNLATGGFVVNPWVREEVRSFYNGVFTASEGVAMSSSAVLTNCLAGTNASTYGDAVLRRINWFRALAGVPASVTSDPELNRKDQQAALMIVANRALSHAPPTSWKCYSADGAEAAGNSNLAGGNAGPEAIASYIQDYGANNAAVGHRRYILYPQTQVMGTGDLPAQGTNWAANATWVFDGNYGGPRPGTRDVFVSWPPPGFVPYPVVFGRWSFSYPDADFSAASVYLRSNGIPVAVRLESVANGYGENTLVWIPAGLDVTGATRWPPPATDTVYSVTISNVAGVGASLFAYSVTVFDPAVPGADYHPTVISGTNQPAVGQSNAYNFTSVTNATGYEWSSGRSRAYSVTDGAENGLTNFVVSTTPGYAVRQTGVKASGSYAFVLAHPTPPSDQTLLLNRVLLPATNTAVIFKSRLGYATSSQVAMVQVSTDEGRTWVSLYSQPGTNGANETVFNTRSISLAAFAGRIASLRFNYHYEIPGSYYGTTNAGTGWYLDDVVVTNTLEVVGSVTEHAATTNFLFKPSQSDAFILSARALIYDEFPLAWGPVKSVTAITSAPPIVITLRPPALTGSQVRIDFTLSSGSASGFSLLRASAASGPWTVDSAAVLSTNTPGAFRYTTSTGGVAGRFFRVRTP